MKFNPYPYQDFTINRILEQPQAGLFLDMGMGKTVCTLTAIDQLLYDTFEIQKVLVIAPLRVADDTWVREVDKWDHLKHLVVAKVLGSEKKRIEALSTKADIYVINRENVPWLVDYYKLKWPFDTVVIDELSSFKSPKAQRFKALKKVRPMFKRIIGLTGTPAPNTLLDLWPQVYLLDMGERLGKTITGYKDRYFEPDKRNGYTIFSWRLKMGAEEAIHNKINDLCVSLQAKDYLSLPPRIDNFIQIDIGTKAMKKYLEFEKERVLELEGEDITAGTAAVVANKLLQIANGCIYDEEGGVHEIHEAKVEALKEILENENGKPVLVFYNFKHDYDTLMNHFSKLEPRTLETADDIKDWNEGKIKMVLAHPASVGHGLNLQAGGNIIIWYGLTWSLELYQQANARLHRQGQTNNVIIHHLVAQNTIDEQVVKALKNKDKNQSVLLEAVKARIENYRRR